MSIKLGDIAPDFNAESSLGNLNFYEFLGDSWGILFSHPADYTPVCTTELGKTSQLKPEFDKRNTKVLALSVDGIENHKGWISDINETQNTEVEFPIIADQDKKVSELYDFIHPNASATLTVRSLLIIDPNKKVRLIITYPASTGRNFTEILRVLDSLQLVDNYGIATPVDWKDGEDVIIPPAVSQEDAEKKFTKGVKMGMLIDTFKSFFKTISKFSRPYFSLEENHLKFKIDIDTFYSFPISNIEMKTRYDSYILEAYTLKADNIYMEYIHTQNDVSWNAQALSSFKDLLKDKIKAKSIDLLEKKEFGHYEFLVYKIDYNFILNLIYIYEINKEIFILDTNGQLYEDLLKNFDKTYVYKFDKNPIVFTDLNLSLVRSNATKNYFSLQA